MNPGPQLESILSIWKWFRHWLQVNPASNMRLTMHLLCRKSSIASLAVFFPLVGDVSNNWQNFKCRYYKDQNKYKIKSIAKKGIYKDKWTQNIETLEHINTPTPTNTYTENVTESRGNGGEDSLFGLCQPKLFNWWNLQYAYFACMHLWSIQTYLKKGIRIW